MLTPDFPPAVGGIQLLVQRLVAHWSFAPSTRVVTLRARGRHPVSAEGRHATIRVRHPPAGGQPAAIGLLNAVAIAEALRFRPRIILCGHLNTGPAALAAKRLLGIPYVVYLHGKEVVARPPLTRLVLRHAAAIVVVSGHTRDLALRHGADPGRVHLIHPGADPVREPGAARAERPTVLTLARLEDRYKGHDVLIRAMPLVRARVPSAQLRVVGDGALRPAYESLAGALGLGDAVMFTGAVSDEERDRLLDGAHVFAMPSRLAADQGGEGFGIVYLEAALHGLASVAGAVGGAVDAVAHGTTGLLVDPTDHVAVADALIELLRDPVRAESLGRSAAERAAGFTWPRMAREVEGVVRAVVEAGR